ncbi:MAG: hypothetical protein H6568_06655 [Lewinellaceae bacterium]|nr:hypothetical protein [Saprospiraceae bacterium]MCB9312429.1 hypothetical protein [Lewinellaceae bacterium]
MKSYIYLALAMSAFVLNSGCKKDSTDPTHEYHAHIHSPNTDAKHVDDVLDIEVEFEDHAGGTVHHIQVRIYNKSTLVEVYRMPTDAHVHATSGSYTFEDTFDLSVANGITGHSDWVLEAKVWGETDGEAEEIETVEFHVHP